MNRNRSSPVSYPPITLQIAAKSIDREKNKSSQLERVCTVWPPLRQLCRPSLLICYPFFPQKTSLEFYIDIHAHSTMMNGFMYGNIFEDEERFQRQSIFPKLLCQNAEDFSYVSEKCWHSQSPPWVPQHLFLPHLPLLWFVFIWPDRGVFGLSCHLV